MLLHDTCLLNPRQSRTLRWHIPIRASSDSPTPTLLSLLPARINQLRAAVTAPLLRAAQRQRLTNLLRTQEGRAVCFEVPTFPLEPADVVLICGDNQALGSWNPQGAPVLSLEMDDTGKAWLHSTRFPPGRFKYKLVLVRADGSAAWEEGPFRELVVEEAPPGEPPLTVSINFNNTYIDNVTAYVAGQLQALDEG